MTALFLALCLSARADQLDAAGRSEALRLEQELGRLVVREAWAGVDRTFRALLDAGASPPPTVWLDAAEASRALGDLSTARSRYLVGVAKVEDRAAIDTLYRIDHEYGVLRVTGATELVPEVEPWLPEARAALAFARAVIEAEGAFAGHLPPGAYRVGDHVVRVAAGASVQVDLRPSSRPRGRRGVR